MSFSKGVTVERVNSFDAGMMRGGKKPFWAETQDFKVGLCHTGYLFITGRYGDALNSFQLDKVTWIKHVPTVDVNGSTSTGWPASSFFFFFYLFHEHGGLVLQPP